MDLASAKENVHRYYRLVDEGNHSGLLGLFAEDAVYERPGYQPLVGRAALRDFYSGERVIADGRHTVRTLVAEGDRIAVHGDFVGVLKDGTDVSLRFADFFVLGADGRFVRRDTFFFSPLV
ncbi:nuclear transport factor 2 family protein [Goodfellowiella coeruleoviolacea]|uniref:Ketosteroid isomerase-related protein n=1 Tax=Goodfellowiella coeruleoviolacea TaxID=334858 RepID=A0AAE3KPN4_9PSEU|nr:nuclear transport factor 2 family protein [Goodfellowiella coeruleoviolacea]MCP2170063.1 Ketosteroid isomerase-related protein [Goodfellowiella coeruleoviolacea]